MLFADATLARRIESTGARIERDFAEALARLRPGSGATALDIAGGVAGFAGIGSPLTQAVGLGMEGPVSDDDLDCLEAFYFERGSPVQVVTCPLADSSLAAGLGRRGYRPVEFENVLFRRIGPDEAAPGPAPGVEVVTATVAEGDGWIDAISEGFAGFSNFPADLREFAATCFAIDVATPMLALVDGEPAGGASLIRHEGVAFLAGSAVRPAWRERGAHTAMLHARLALARAAGDDLAVMGALPGSGSQRNVERMGFRVAYTRVALLRDPPGPEAGRD